VGEVGDEEAEAEAEAEEEEKTVRLCFGNPKRSMYVVGVGDVGDNAPVGEKGNDEDVNNDPEWVAAMPPVDLLASLVF
jgi:hypothetical protein